MFKVRFYDGTTVSLLANSPNESARQLWEGDSVKACRFRLENAYGAFGHGLGLEFATPIDLHYAVFDRLAGFDPVVVEGAEMVEVYDSGIPEGSVT